VISSLRIIFIVLLLATSYSSDAIDSDALLRKIIEARQIRPLPTRKAEIDPKFLLGQALFFDPILSGNREIACGTCHLLSHGTGDGLPLSVGVGGTGLGSSRVGRLEIEHPRNSQDLWNRDNNHVSSLFWDGRVEMLDPKTRQFRSPMGDLLPNGLENTLAVQALFPVARVDEMLGIPGEKSDPNLPNGHGGQLNELASAGPFPSEPHRIAAVLDRVMNRILDCTNTTPNEWQSKFRQLFVNAFSSRDHCDFTFVDAANAIAHFEEVAFATRATPWDQYISGDLDALTVNQKLGAIVFYGAGRCAVCHSGPLFSDFKFHSIGVTRSGPGIDGQVDMGRYHATGAEQDKFKFRTPPLRNVTLTSPYFHNGTAATLEAAILQHLDPLYFADKYHEDGGQAMMLNEIDAVSPILRSAIRISDDDVQSLIQFLYALEDYPAADWIEIIVPSEVPSGLSVHYSVR